MTTSGGLPPCAWEVDDRPEAGIRFPMLGVDFAVAGWLEDLEISTTGAPQNHPKVFSFSLEDRKDSVPHFMDNSDLLVHRGSGEFISCSSFWATKSGSCYIYLMSTVTRQDRYGVSAAYSL